MFSTYAIGGPAEEFYTVESIEEMQEVLHDLYARKISFIVVGKGSNCLFDDRGFRGAVILNKIGSIEWKENSVFVGAGYSFSLLGAQSARNHLSGLEFASGIPASVGGAVYMNAGANGKETKDALQKVTYVDEKGTLIMYEKSEISFSYRYSSFQEKKGAIVAAEFLLETCENAKKTQSEIIFYRKKTQPLNEKSCGCVFRNPEGVSAGKVIEECGLKGVKIGGAEVSLVHGNFIINADNASSRDILALIAHVQKIVLEKKGIYLEPEMRIIPYEI